MIYDTTYSKRLVVHNVPVLTFKIDEKASTDIVRKNGVQQLARKSTELSIICGICSFQNPASTPPTEATSLDHFYRMTRLHGLMENCASSRVTITRSWEAKQVLRAQRIVLEEAFAGAHSRAAG